ncbi:MAG: PrsW family intramembrane metalloprotease [Bacteroidetes bacterium]|nr:PrsW family intramembrane metalloprotease [Bacteroidota bacterium]
MFLLLLLCLAIAPGIAISVFVYWRDKFDKEPLYLLVKCFLLGLLSIIPAIIIELVSEKVFGVIVRTNGLNVAFHSFIIVGLSEEWSKYIFLCGFAYPKSDFNEPYDGITYSVMISMGFATLENLMYVVNGGFSVAIMRMFLSVPAHATFGMIMGYYVGLAKFRNNSFRLRLTGLVAAVFFHGAFDFCLLIDSTPIIILGAIVSLIIGIILSLKAIKHHSIISPFNPTVSSEIQDDSLLHF